MNTQDKMTTSPPAVSSATVSITTTASPQTVVMKGKRYRQRPLGPAPFASFEDLSDELDSPPETARVPLPGIKEDPASQIQTPITPSPASGLSFKDNLVLKEVLTGQLQTPATPRIDISRASSSSQHEDSVTSSPDKDGVAATLGFNEDGTQELRSSTEELDYVQEPGTVEESEAKRRREKMMKKQHQLKQDFQDTQSEKDFKERKDSNVSVVSDVGLLCISGRTSRLSSIGSAASGGSSASHVSGGSHLSVGSNVSRSSRSPSPHKMLLETSFCGVKPIHTQSIDVEAAPGLVSHVEKPASRPPSRLRSRSPSPHKMLLETSFCGTKQHPVSQNVKENGFDAVAKEIKTLTSGLVTEAEVTPEKAHKPRQGPRSRHRPKEKVEEAKPTVEEIKTEKKKTEKIDRSEIENEIIEISDDPNVKIIPLHSPPKKAPTAPKKVDIPRLPARIPVKKKPNKIISLRDLPDDEIFIPLTGPEVDFEEILRRSSPKPKRKESEVVPTTTTTESADCIYIPLHSPPKSDKTVQVIPTVKIGDREHHKEPKKTSPQLGSSRIKFGTRQYQVCKDGSIFIPLHSPDDDKNKFDDEIRRVDEELERAQEAERRDKQSKPITLDLTDTISNRSRLSQSYSTTKPELTSGSRTPSPGSTISRKSSFASLFRRSELSASPDSPAGSMIRKKSGTFSNILKEASEGLRERSRSRSKSGDRSSQSSLARSPSLKKNVFTNIFSKKKPEPKSVQRKEEEQLAPKLDFQFTFSSGQTSNEGDYIIIPLRDPSDPPAELDDVTLEQETKSAKEVEMAQETEISVEVPRLVSPSKKEEIRIETSPTSTEDISKKKNKCSEVDTIRLSKSSSGDVEDLSRLKSPSGNSLSKQQTPAEVKSEEPAGETDEIIVEQVKMNNLELIKSSSLQHDSSVELEDELKEEIVTVSADGVRKLKLPPERGDLEEDHERKGLVLQESFEDELPYVPTTLPLERSRGVQIIPIKQRTAEVKTNPIERPRSITPINPATLEDYVTVRERNSISEEEKLKISLPRTDSMSYKSKSPRKLSGGKGGKTLFEFAEAGIYSPRDNRKNSLPKSPSPPPLPPRSVHSQTTSSSAPAAVASSSSSSASGWINFEELPERKKLPKRITTVPPLRGSIDGTGEKQQSTVPGASHIAYSYVNPEDCQCECHDHNTNSVQETETSREYFQCNNELKTNLVPSVLSECKNCENGHRNEIEEEIPLLDNNSDFENDDSTSKKEWELQVPGSKRNQDPDGHSNVSDSSIAEGAICIDIVDNSAVFSEILDGKPFAIDLDVHSNRSSIISQEEQQEEIMSRLPP